MVVASMEKEASNRAAGLLLEHLEVTLNGVGFYWKRNLKLQFGHLCWGKSSAHCSLSSFLPIMDQLRTLTVI